MTDPNILVAGEALLDFLPQQAGPLAEVDAFTRRPGGAPANVAVALSRLERPPLFWTRIGDDPFGEVIIRALDRNGVPTRFVERDPSAKTSLAFVAHDEAGDPTFSFYRDGTADTRFERGRVGGDTLEAVRWVVLGGVALSSDPTRSAVLDLARRASERDCTVVFDPNARPELWGERDFPTEVGRILEHVDVVAATPDDLAAAGIEADGPGSLGRAVCERGPHTVLITMGDAGAYGYASPGSRWGPCEADHPGYEVEVTDTTGAGDAFLAGAITALEEGASLQDALAFANAVAALATTAEGAMTALPEREALREFRAGR